MVETLDLVTRDVPMVDEAAGDRFVDCESEGKD